MSVTPATPGTDAPIEGAGASVEPIESTWHRFTHSTLIVTFAALLTSMIVFAIKAPGQFDTVSNFRQLAQNVAILTVVSVGTTFVIATAGVDLSIPSGIVLGEVFGVKALGLIHIHGVGTAVDVAGDESRAASLATAELSGRTDSENASRAAASLPRIEASRRASSSNTVPVTSIYTPHGQDSVGCHRRNARDCERSLLVRDTPGSP